MYVLTTFDVLIKVVKFKKCYYDILAFTSFLPTLPQYSLRNRCRSCDVDISVGVGLHMIH